VNSENYKLLSINIDFGGPVDSFIASEHHAAIVLRQENRFRLEDLRDSAYDLTIS
jgi:hypothetical protein